jgi:hypothetical protein
MPAGSLDAIDRKNHLHKAKNFYRGIIFSANIIDGNFSKRRKD